MEIYNTDTRTTPSCDPQTSTTIGCYTYEVNGITLLKDVGKHFG